MFLSMAPTAYIMNTNGQTAPKRESFDVSFLIGTQFASSRGVSRK
jgi:hypothetical protein